MKNHSEILDIEKPHQIITYLRRIHKIASDEVPAVRVLAGGVSNRTVLVERANGEAWVLKQALEKLRVPVDWFSSPERVHREALGLRWLAELAPQGTTTKLLHEDFENHVIAMEAVAEPHANWKTALLGGDLQDAHVSQFARLLAAVHGAAFARRDELASIFAERTFFESLRLEPYYGFAAEQVPAADPFLTALIEETRARTLTLVHGDYSPKNVLVREGKLILLDHEVIHWGDPAFDLGFAMTHLLSKAHHLKEEREAFGQATNLFWRTYADALNPVPWRSSLEAFAVRHTLACLLARVDGRSPLEYLTDAERSRQRAVVVGLMQAPPTTVAELVRSFNQKLGIFSIK